MARARFSLVVFACALAAYACASCNGGEPQGDGNGASNGSPSPADDRAGFSVGGDIDGLVGHGLVLDDGAGDELAVDGDGPFVFARHFAAGEAYDVHVARAPADPAETCVVTDGQGVASGDVTGVHVACTTRAYTIGGAIVDLRGSGLVLTNGADTLHLAPGTATFRFPTSVVSGGPFAVAVKAQPAGPAQTCAVSGGTGTVVAGDVVTVLVDCRVRAFALGGTVTNLIEGPLVLEDLASAASADATISTSGAFTFPTPRASGSAYDVRVKIAPPHENCTVTGGTGTMGDADVGSIGVACTPAQKHAVGGTVTGLVGHGLTLRINEGETVTVDPSHPTFTFPNTLEVGTAYAVDLAANPTGPWQTCTVSHASGVVAGADITNIAVACTTNTVSVGGTITGLLGSGLVLTNGADTLPIPAGAGAFRFPTPVASGAAYAAAIRTQPASPTQTCTLMGGAGTVGSGDVTNLVVACGAPAAFPIGGTLANLLVSSIVLENNGADDLTLTANGPFTFATRLPSGSGYSVTQKATAASTTQTCAIAGGTGTVGGAAVTGVAVTCGVVNGPGGNVPDATGCLTADSVLASDIVITADLFAVRHVEVTLHGFTHPSGTQLEASLTHLDSSGNRYSELVLFDFPTSCDSGDDVAFAGDYTFTDAAKSSLAQGTMGGKFTPGAYYANGSEDERQNLDGPMPKGFGGNRVAGTWRLTLIDFVPDAVGKLAGWSILLTP
jgi:hypothetical protein